MTDSTPYGAWPSPLSARDTVTAGIDRSVPQVDGDSLLWLETRPQDEGRLTLVHRDAAARAHDLSPAGVDVRTRFQEYGGGAFGVSGGIVVYVDFADQRVHRVDLDGAPDGGASDPRPITPDSDGLVRFSCFRVDHRRGLVLALREDQRDASLEPVTSLVSLRLDGTNDDYGVELVAGRRRPRDVAEELPADLDSPPDFVADHVLSADGRRLAWLSWNHPRMPWDGTWLWVGTLDEQGGLGDVRLVAGAEDESVEQPRWYDDDRLVFLSDRTGWSNLYAVDLSRAAEDGAEPGDAVPLCPDDHDHGQPRWVPDLSSYDVLPDGRIVTTRFTDGWCGLRMVDPGTGTGVGTGTGHDVDSEISAAFDVRALGRHHVVCRATFVDRPADVVTVDLRDGSVTPVGPAGEAPDPAWVSRPEALSWPAEDGATTHGFLYPPTNPDVTPPPGESPPLVVTLHGGPTAAAPAAYTRARTFWTSRGFAVLDVNYAGSTGFGRAYRQRLDRQWGIADVADVAGGARHLVDAGRVNPAHLAITGGSAGGYTTLAALSFTDAFAAGASHFGISDLAALVRDTHKLESRYLHGLVAPWPEGEDVYVARSPLHHVDRLATPLILLQGTDDRVVPRNQAELMADAVRAKGLPVALVLFEGEGHGFRDPVNRARALECELSFYAQVFGFTPAGDIEPVEVENR